ncbi:hypothetical protein CN168_19955 [Sinorhizobium medicae]|nr:hypothetical protein CN168_19955 [Sinorhizobium medicae]
MLRHDVETAILSHEVMEAQNAIVPKGLEGQHTDFVHTYGAIQNALVLKLALDVARVFDFSLRYPVERQDMASIPVLGMLLDVAGVVDELTARASSWISGIEWANDNDGDRSAEVEAAAIKILGDEQTADKETCKSALAEFAILANRLSDPTSAEASALSRVKGFRNRRLAHSLFNKEPDAYPKYEDLTLLLDMAKMAARLSSLAVEGLHVDFADQMSRNRTNAEGYARLVLEGLKRSAQGPRAVKDALEAACFRAPRRPPASFGSWTPTSVQSKLPG